MIPKKVLLVYMPGFSRQLKQIESSLDRSRILYVSKNRKDMVKADFNTDLVISLGGDGTFMNASHFIHDQTPMLGVNPDISGKEGFFTRATPNDFIEKLGRIINGRYRKVRLFRLQAKINGKLVSEHCLNEFYFGRATGYHMSLYKINALGMEEVQKSSGVLVGTAQSSYSWIRSAGGRVLKLTSRRFQFIVREPYNARLSHSTILNGTLPPGEKISLVPLSTGFILVVDSLREYVLRMSDQVEITTSKHNLNFITF